LSKLHLISKEGDAKNAKADVIFVHGLGGDPFSTWRHDNNEGQDAWPYWLAEAMPEAAVHALEYEAAPVAWLGKAFPLGKTAERVLGVLIGEGVVGERPIVFVGHSMGGLLIKQILRKTSDRSAIEGWRRIRHATRAVVFLGTPIAAPSWPQCLNGLGRFLAPIRRPPTFVAMASY
jgi:pimeloyl-ACP methyl ester carboxylesterase